MTLYEFHQYWKAQEVNFKQHKIYKITNKVNGKVYIGYTKRPICERFREHIGYVQNGKFGSAIHNSIVKHGWENFLFEVIEDSDDGEYLRETRENYWINYYNSRKHGYNIAAGGNYTETTLGTHIYNNGKAQRFIKEGDPIPKGFVRGALPKSMETLLKLSKPCPSKKGRIPVNKNKGLSDPSVRENAKNASATIRRTKIGAGACNPRALHWICINPAGNRYDIIGTIKEFCIEHKLSYVLVKMYIDKGIVPKRGKSCYSAIAWNTVGWSFSIDRSVDSVKEARKARVKRRLEAIADGTAGRTQKNINKITMPD